MSTDYVTDVDGNEYAVRTVDYVVKHFTAREQAAKREYLQRKRLRESLVGQVSQLDPNNIEEREALISQVLQDCEELSQQKMNEAWSTEKQYGQAFDILREGLGHPGDPTSPRYVREPNPRKVQIQWSPRSADGKPNRFSGRPMSAMVARTEPTSPSRQRPASASIERRDSLRLSRVNDGTQKAKTTDKPWRSSMSLKKIKKLERKHRKKDSPTARLAKALKKTKGGGKTKRRSHKKLVPKLEHFPTYGPQNVAARALRKHKGRTLNPETSHQFAVTRANAHMKVAAAAQAKRRQDKVEKARLIKERLKKLEAHAKKTVAQFAQSPVSTTKVPAIPKKDAGFLRPTKSSSPKAAEAAQ